MKKSHDQDSNVQMEENPSQIPNKQIYPISFNEGSVGQDKEPLMDIFKLLELTLDQCQSIEDSSNCHNVILKQLSIFVKSLYRHKLIGESAGQDKEPIIATLESLEITQDYMNQCPKAEKKLKMSQRHLQTPQYCRQVSIPRQTG